MSDNRKAWTNQEDHAICTLVKKHGTHRWSEISKRMADHFGHPGRTGKQCRQRWHNHLNPKINKSAWTDQEQRILFQCHQQYGNKWKSIASHLKGRTDNDIKNKFYSSMRKKLRKINKMLGVKNSTSQVRQIKPKVLSNIINASSSTDQTVQQAWQELSKLIFCKDDKKLQKMVKGEDRQKIIQLIEKISSINETYLETKDSQKIPSKKQSIEKVQEKDIEPKQVEQKNKSRARRLSLRRRQSITSLSKAKKKTSTTENPALDEPNLNFNFSLTFTDPSSPGFFSSFTPVIGRKSSVISANNNNNFQKQSDYWNGNILNPSPMVTRSNFRTPKVTPGATSMSSSGLIITQRQNGFGNNDEYDNIQKNLLWQIQRNSLSRQ